MKFNHPLFPILIFLNLLIFSCTTYASTKEENFLLIHGQTSEIIIEFGPAINLQISPCSTFKIILSLMGYDSAILKDETNPIWNFQEGYDNELLSWRAPQSPLSWMKHSFIWYSKILSLELGLEKIQGYLTSFEYGNQEISRELTQSGFLNTFWINSSLKISPKEQVSFIQKMITEQLPISHHAIQTTKILLFKEQLPGGWKLFGKTGWGGEDNTIQHSWFVGWIEKDHHFYPFAYLIREKNIDLDQRIPRVKELITLSKVMVAP